MAHRPVEVRPRRPLLASPPHEACSIPAVAAPQSGNAETLSAVVIKLGRLIERRLNRNLRSRGLTAGQFMVLAHVARFPGASRADIARSVHVTPQAVGGATAQLLTSGLLTRARPRPGGSVSFTITPAGIDILEVAEPDAEALDVQMLRLIRPDLTALLDGACRHVLTRLGHESPR